MLCSLRNDRLSGDRKTPSPIKGLSLLHWLLAAGNGANQVAYSTTRPSVETLGPFFYPFVDAYLNQVRSSDDVSTTVLRLELSQGTNESYKPRLKTVYQK